MPGNAVNILTSPAINRFLNSFGETADNNTITENAIDGYNKEYGIYLTSSNNNTIQNNVIKSAIYGGIKVASSSNYNKILNNSIGTNTGAGIYVQNSDNNLFDNTAARKDLGFRVTIPWIEGVRRTIAWLEENDRLEKSEDFPIYDRIIESWQWVIENLPEITAS